MMGQRKKPSWMRNGQISPRSRKYGYREDRKRETPKFTRKKRMWTAGKSITNTEIFPVISPTSGTRIMNSRSDEIRADRFLERTKISLGSTMLEMRVDFCRITGRDVDVA